MKLLNATRITLLLVGLLSLSFSSNAQIDCNDPLACNFFAGSADESECCYDNCLTLTMTDTFGDGWNGAVWDIVDIFTGVEIATGTLVTGFEEITIVCVPDGCYNFIVGSGNFDAEISWLLQGTTAGDLSGGAPSTTFITVGTTCVAGCTDMNACNFDPFALIDDGSCEYGCIGCTDPLACNYQSEAVQDDGSCLFAAENDLFENYITLTSGQALLGDICCANAEIENPCVSGADPGDLWYHVNSGSCSDLQFSLVNQTSESMGMTIWAADCAGCSELNAVACCPAVTGQCSGSLATILTLQPDWDYYFSVWTGNADECGTFTIEIVCPEEGGCMDPLACNFDPTAQVDDGSCLYVDACGVCGGEGYAGCVDSLACNFDPLASCPDNTCEYPLEDYLDCDGNCISDSNNDGVCDGQTVFGCDTEFACNYDPIVTENDGSCFFATAVYDCEGNCQQDTDGDGICDQNEGQNGAEFCGDYTVWDPITQTCVGIDECPADLNNDYIIDTTDLLLFLISFGTACE